MAKSKKMIAVVMLLERPRGKGAAPLVRRLLDAVEEMQQMHTMTMDQHHFADVVSAVEDLRQIMRRARASIQRE
jgi:hypothetical protein